MERGTAPGARIEEAIEAALPDGLDDSDNLSELGRFGAQLVLQRTAEAKVGTFLGRALESRASSYVRALPVPASGLGDSEPHPT